MMRQIAGSAFLFAALWFIAGCSADKAELISQPGTAKPGDTISVVLSDIYVIVSTTASTTTAYERDSLHVVFGIPAGWELLSADYYLASGLKINQITSIASDSTLLTGLLTDSLAVYQARETPLAPDPSWSSYFVNKTMYAHDFGTDSIPVNVDSVSQWVSFGAKIGLSYPKGTAMDTSYAVSSLPIDTSSIPAAVKILYGSVKTIWVKTVPIVCFARMVTGPQADSVNLYYFTKTNSLPSSAVTLIPDFDKGDLTYAPITLSTGNAVRNNSASPTAFGALRIRAGAGETTVFEISDQGKAELSICDMTGQTVRRFNVRSALAQTVTWDGTTSGGVRVKAGMYIARLETQGQAGSLVFCIVK